MTRPEARLEGFDIYAYTFLCIAFADMKKYVSRGFTARILPETMCTQKFNVYFLAVKDAHKLTRRERGADIPKKEK